MFMARHYPLGTALRMGPGYFPMILGGVLILFGVVLILRGLRSDQKIQGQWSIRALVVLPISMALFGVLIDLAGFIPAIVGLVFLSSASSRECKFFEVLSLSVSLSVISVILFIWGLGLPYPLIKGF